MALELSLETKVRPAPPSGAVCSGANRVLSDVHFPSELFKHFDILSFRATIDLKLIPQINHGIGTFL